MHRRTCGIQRASSDEERTYQHHCTEKGVRTPRGLTDTLGVGVKVGVTVKEGLREGDADGDGVKEMVGLTDASQNWVTVTCHTHTRTHSVQASSPRSYGGHVGQNAS